MNLVQSFLTKNPCYTCGRTIVPKGLMIHSVGCPQPNASVFINNWNKASYSRACVHGFIDANTGIVYQTLPWNRRGWHGGGSSNNTHIGVEMCEPDCIKYTGGATFTCSNKARAVEMAERTYKAAVELFAMLCKQYNLNPLAKGVVISHAEGSKMGIASGHGDPDHLWKQLGMNVSMDTFRADIKKVLDGGQVQVSTPVGNTSNVSNDSQAVTPLDGKVQVIYAGGVNVRTSPAKLSNNVKQTVRSGIFSVVGISADKAWYKLSSGLYITTDSSLVKFTATADTSWVSDYKVRIDIDDLNIRTGPGTNYSKTGKCTGKGVFTIVEETNGWGLLKSYKAGRNGWVSLAYCKKV